MDDQVGRGERSARWPWLVWGVVVSGLVPTLLLVAWNESFGEDPYFVPIAIMMIVGYSTAGAVLASRDRGNAIGWLLMSVGAIFLLIGLTDEYLRYAGPTDPQAPTVAIAALIATALWLPILAVISLIALLFPSGTVPGPRWRAIPRLIVGGVGAFLVATILYPGPFDLQDTYGEVIENPLGVDAIGPVVSIVSTVGWITALLCIPFAIAGLVVRFRRSAGEERQQIRWLVYVAVAILVLVLIQLAFGLAGADETSLVQEVLFLLTFTLIGIGIPTAISVAVLRYRLYDLDLVIKKTAMFAVVLVVLLLVAAVALLVIGGVLVGSGVRLADVDGDDAVPIAIAVGVLVGLSVVPVLRLARKVADRIAYGGRATSYEVLTDFGRRMAEGYAPGDVLQRIATLLREATGAERAIVWLALGNRSVPSAIADDPGGGSASTPETLADAEATDEVVEVQHRGEVLGALSVRMPANDHLDGGRRRMVDDLAAQAGLALRNVRLIEDLRASRRRLVAAQDEERHKLERNIHDGVQQQLVALNVQLGLLAKVAESDAEKAGRLATTLQERTTATLEELRDLARGIYPPLLADKGLGVALEAQGRRAAVPVTVATDGIGRYAPEAEAAVYFCCLEALNNVAKYAHASQASVQLEQRNGTLTFRVADDGRGFDATSTTHGTGLQGIADRLDAVGGTFDIESVPGTGTTVTGTVPARPP